MNTEALLQELGISYWSGGTHKNVRSGWYATDCPECSPGSGKALLGIPEGGRVASCWTCGTKSLYSVLRELSSAPPKQIIELLDQLPSARVPTEDLIRGKLKLPEGLGPLRKAHKNYLLSRGLDPNELEKLWDLQGLGADSKLGWRIFIPVKLRYQTVTWLTRSITDRPPAYLNAKPEEEKVSVRNVLFGEDFCTHTIAVNEGSLDAMKLGPGAVATLGVGYSQKQMLRMAAYPRRIIVFDNEPAAQKRARKLCEELACLPGETINVQFESAKDAVRASNREIKKFRKHYLEK